MQILVSATSQMGLANVAEANLLDLWPSLALIDVSDHADGLDKISNDAVVNCALPLAPAAA